MSGLLREVLFVTAIIAACAHAAVAQVVEVQLRVVASASADLTTVLPDSEVQACAGAGQFIEIWVTNVGTDTPGIVGGTVDVLFSPAVTAPSGIDHGTLFQEFPTGEIDNAAGIVNDLGGVTLEPGVAVAPAWAILGRVAITTTVQGTATFSLAPGAFQFALAGGNPPLEFGQDVTLGSRQTLNIISPSVVGDMDCDNDADLDDLIIFDACATGPALPGDPFPLPPICAPADLDGDGDVDLVDFGVFQRQFLPVP